MSVRGSTSLLLAMLGAATPAGSWCAVVEMPHLGLVAAAELGVALKRLALVPNPGLDWPEVAGALLDGIVLVVAAVPTANGPHARASSLGTRSAARLRTGRHRRVARGPT